VVRVVGREDNVAVLGRVLESALALLKQAVHEVAQSAAREQAIHLHVRIGDVAQTLEQVAIDYDADLVVVGTHGRNAAARLVLGSVAEKLTRSAHVSVLVAREKTFEGLPRTPAIEAPTPGLALRGDQHVSEVIQVGRRDGHVSGMV
jgi:hypothetical protein